MQLALCTIVVLAGGVGGAIASGALSQWAAAGMPPIFRLGLGQFLLYVGVTTAFLAPFGIRPRDLGMRRGVPGSGIVGAKDSA